MGWHHHRCTLRCILKTCWFHIIICLTSPAKALTSLLAMFSSSPCQFQHIAIKSHLMTCSQQPLLLGFDSMHSSAHAMQYTLIHQVVMQVEELVQLQSYKDGNLGQALSEVYLHIDSILATEEKKPELENLASKEQGSGRCASFLHLQLWSTLLVSAC